VDRQRVTDAAIELAEATLDMLAHRNAHPVLHVKRAYRAEVTADKEARFLQKLVTYQQRKRWLASKAPEERV
jgi:hypothetical protein